MQRNCCLSDLIRCGFASSNLEKTLQGQSKHGCGLGSQVSVYFVMCACSEDIAPVCTSGSITDTPPNSVSSQSEKTKTPPTQTHSYCLHPMIDTYTKPKISVCKLATVLNKPVKATCVNATALQPQGEKELHSTVPEIYNRKRGKTCFKFQYLPKNFSLPRRTVRWHVWDAFVYINVYVTRRPIVWELVASIITQKLQDVPIHLFWKLDYFRKLFQRQYNMPYLCKNTNQLQHFERKNNNLLTAYACQQAGKMQLGLLTAKTS